MKQLLRMRHSARRNALGAKAVEEKSAGIAAQFLELPAVRGAKTIMLYVGVKNEVQTTALIGRLLGEGKRVVVPVTDFRKKIVQLSELKSLGELEEKKFGLMEPKDDVLRPVKEEELDVIVVPGIAFDRHGGRIGRGMGFYDRLLRKISRKATLVGFCFSENLEEALPCESHDVKMDFVATDSGVIACK